MSSWLGSLLDSPMYWGSSSPISFRKTIKNNFEAREKYPTIWTMLKVLSGAPVQRARGIQPATLIKLRTSPPFPRDYLLFVKK